MTSSQLQSTDQSASLLAHLRARTAAHHAQLDAALNFRPGEVTPARYIGHLRGTLNVLAALAPAVTDLLGKDVWAPRLASLHSDLAQLGAAPATDPVPITLPTTIAQAYGCAYVVEGSALGGMVLASVIERELALPMGQATRYLRLWGQETAAHWRTWLGQLAEFSKSVGPAEHEQACVMACATFDSYARALQQQGAIVA